MMTPDSFLANNFLSVPEESIPKTSSNKKNHNTPWFNGDCKTAIRSRRAALR